MFKSGHVLPIVSEGTRPIKFDSSVLCTSEPYGYNYGAGQVTSVGPYYYSASAATDGWYIISTHLSPWSGPIPYGTITSSYNGTFAWLYGSFWHSGTNNNRANGFGVCDGWPSESGSTVPGGRWVWGVWQT
jgi:hypothetical protein